MHTKHLGQLTELPWARFWAPGLHMPGRQRARSLGISVVLTQEYHNRPTRRATSRGVPAEHKRLPAVSHPHINKYHTPTSNPPNPPDPDCSSHRGTSYYGLQGGSKPVSDVMELQPRQTKSEHKTETQPKVNEYYKKKEWKEQSSLPWNADWELEMTEG